MGTIWIKEMTGGLDTRRLPETTPGGVLIKAQDGHITRGGEFEQRAAFVSEYQLPEGTHGLAYDRGGLVVFGTDNPPAGLPVGVAYQRLQNPDDSSTQIDRVLSHDLYDKKLYVSVLYVDGSVHHFYDGTVVDDWYDGRARAQFSVLGGAADPAQAAASTFRVTGGSIGGSGSVDNVAANGVSITANAVAHTGDNAATAAAIAAEITSAASTPEYTATSDGDEVTVYAPPGVAGNGRTLSLAISGDFAHTAPSLFLGGSDEATSELTALTINGVAAITAPVEWQGTPESTAIAIAAAINDAVSGPEYEATASGTEVNVIADAAGAAQNGHSVDLVIGNGLVVSPSSGLEMAGGADSDAFTPGPFVKTVSTKMYAVADGLLHFSGIQLPTQWTTDAIGAGFINQTVEDSKADDLKALARYQGQLAVFAKDVTLIWYIDPDPTLNNLSQILAETGTKHPKSVTQFGDSDVFYLDASGLRSLRARDSSNAAATTDIGVPIDGLVTAKARDLVGQEHLVCGLINPLDKRFWLVMRDEIFVFSFYENAKVSAWSTYKTSTTAEGEASVPFDVDTAVVFAGRPHLRARNTIYVYGGVGDSIAYDATEAEGWLPYLDANKPTAAKNWDGIDVALSGLWEISVAAEPTEIEAASVVARCSETTFNAGRLPYSHSSSHASLRFKSKGAGEGPAVFSAAVIHYKGDDDEN
ncbi:hypothetical protein PhaeoP66_03207 [Phaeobacter inhibens]|uniref:Major tropism determinant N-terminal domain-containing protein n=1 Tax=Phaeobacter inhibens TaxID=221822 RepID=A0ABN5GQR4_9RHOB|nr:hypothetical protein [Phaeobacter inhibens]AUQ95949.1 hypothetical protein PhaeoP66_03207 [Phaeobacter inhibens]